MSNIELIIDEREADIGGFKVGRLLPFRKKRMVGPFAFIDHMGPVELNAEQNLDVAMHPHIGLATLTYLFDGVILHRDSLGTVAEIEPGAVNWMVAGKGVVHTERTPKRFRQSKKSLHGLQIWVALPKVLEQCEPAFSHTAAADIPTWTKGGLSYTLICGELLGKRSPVPILSPTYFIEIKANKKQSVDLSGVLYGECAIYILNGQIMMDGEVYKDKQMLVLKNSTQCEFTMTADSAIYIFGGEPFPEPRYIDWNFVATDKNLIEQAKADWQADKFARVPDESERIPLPSR